MFRPIAQILTAVLPVAAATAVVSPATAATDRIDFARSLQPIDGFGFSQAFQRATLIQGLDQRSQREVLDLLLYCRPRVGGEGTLALIAENDASVLAVNVADHIVARRSA